jgi:phospholipid/cholesterol/gamma-HCH transport system permease protein
MSGSRAEPARLDLRDEDGATVLAFAGTLDAAGLADIWNPALAAATGDGTLVVDLAGVTACDTAGAALLSEVLRLRGEGAELRGASPQVSALLERVRGIGPVPPPPSPKPITWREALRGGMVAALGGVAFLGEAVVATLRLPTRLRQFRRADLLRTADQAGVQAIPLTLLLGTLMGLILAFQSLVPMRRFGADIYVANLVAISLVRELGPLLAAVILAGRTGSAFAAEIGTMKVNQEIDALATMDIDPVTMLVLPRMLAAMLVMPALTVVMEMSGLLGMTLVMVGAGYPPITVGNQVAQWVQPADFYGGLAKAVVFGAVVAGIGCRAGLATGIGPRAVGLSATSAVVGGIVATIVLDGIFAVVYYRLGW